MDFLLRRAGKDRGFIDEVFKVGASKTGRTARNGRGLHCGSNGLPLTCTLRMASRPFDIGTIKRYAAVKTTGAQQRRVKNIGAVGGGNDNDIGIGIETVHFNQHLVEGLFTFIVEPPSPAPR
jgi:hypothetical protein